MLACLIVGDSIGAGAGAALRSMLENRCVISVQVGASTNQIAAMVPQGDYATAVISAGSNDAESYDLDRRLNRLRASVSARYVVWIMPYQRRAAQIVRVTAARFGDRVIDLAGLATRDGIHPSTYRGLAVALTTGGYAGQPR